MYLMHPLPDIYHNDHSIFFSLPTVSRCLKTLCLQGMMGLISQAFVHKRRHRHTHEHKLCSNLIYCFYSFSVEQFTCFCFRGRKVILRLLHFIKKDCTFFSNPNECVAVVGNTCFSNKSEINIL